VSKGAGASEKVGSICVTERDCLECSWQVEGEEEGKEQEARGWPKPTV
jgi:hypothetical protein